MPPKAAAAAAAAASPANLAALMMQSELPPVKWHNFPATVAVCAAVAATSVLYGCWCGSGHAASVGAANDLSPIAVASAAAAGEKVEISSSSRSDVAAAAVGAVAFVAKLLAASVMCPTPGEMALSLFTLGKLLRRLECLCGTAAAAHMVVLLLLLRVLFFFPVEMLIEGRGSTFEVGRLAAAPSVLWLCVALATYVRCVLPAASRVSGVATLEEMVIAWMACTTAATAWGGGGINGAVCGLMCGWALSSSMLAAHSFRFLMPLTKARPLGALWRRLVEVDGAPLRVVPFLATFHPRPPPPPPTATTSPPTPRGPHHQHRQGPQISEEFVKSLEEMGFGREEAVRALRSTGNDVNAAASQLLGHPAQ